jgi:prevent-host-death family protein
MTTINVHEAKTHLSKYLNLTLQGEEVVICKRNIPIARLVPEKLQSKKRCLGGLEDKIKIEDSFYNPLPDDILQLFHNPTINL